MIAGETGRTAMVDFVLVHGGLAGAWCWELLMPELARLGHRSTAMDLPISDPQATIDDYADAVVAAAAGLSGAGMGRPWLVGHSMGGLVIPRAALKRQAAGPVAGLIFICAGFPPRTPAEHEENYATRNPGNEAHFVPAGDGLVTLSFEGAAHDFFNDCAEDLQRRLYARFRPQATAPFAHYNPISHYPDVPMHAIVTADDNIVLKHLHTPMIRKRIGVEPVELPGGHCQFVSRPGELARVMDGMVGKEEAN
jgi:pimeloyl-ACP methyl ester carboxylesterase